MAELRTSSCALVCVCACVCQCACACVCTCVCICFGESHSFIRPKVKNVNVPHHPRSITVCGLRHWHTLEANKGTCTPTYGISTRSHKPTQSVPEIPCLGSALAEPWGGVGWNEDVRQDTLAGAEVSV